MTVLLIVRFTLKNRTIDQEKASTEQIVPLINEQEGFVSKIWAGDDGSGQFSGVYEFETRGNAEAYLSSPIISHLRRSDNLVGAVEAQIYEIYRKQVQSANGRG